VLGIVYSSEARNALDEQKLQDLARAAQARNTRDGISGYLYCHGDHFVGYIEGPDAAVEAAMARIEQDPRHQVRHVLRSTALKQRRLYGWRMEAAGWRDALDLRLEHVLEVMLQQTSAPMFGKDRTRAGVWRLVDAIARRQMQFGKPSRLAGTRLAFGR
jgi:hypothetical protein